MLLPAPPLYPRKRKQRPVRKRPAPPVSNAPVLVSAEFLITDGAYVVLGFDRAVSADGIELGAFVVLRHTSEEQFEGSTVELIDPATVKIGLANTESTTPGDDIVMNVATDNGIVAVDGGEAWAGATGVVLPFP